MAITERIMSLFMVAYFDVIIAFQLSIRHQIDLFCCVENPFCLLNNVNEWQVVDMSVYELEMMRIKFNDLY